MRIISEKNALERLALLRNDLTETIRETYEHRARRCASCPVQGSCCLDAHFVNVRISRLEARAINAEIDRLDTDTRKGVLDRTAAAVSEYQLERGQDKFACPLFESGVGCLVHATAKPTACIIHACYDSKDDLPPDHLQDEYDTRIDRLNRLTYGRDASNLPLPLALGKAREAL